MERLRQQHEKLAKLYEEHEETVRSLQQQAMREIPPDVSISLALSEDEGEWVADYLRDTAALFRIFRRQKFIASFTHEALRAAVVWRLQVLKPAIAAAVGPMSQKAPGLSALRCLPLRCADNLGRPLAVLRVAELDLAAADAELLRRDVVLSLERLRVALQRTNEQQKARGPGGDAPVLQYAMVLDLENVSTKSIPIDLIQWYLREVQPWYYGIIGAAYIINYNWAHSGLWSIMKHLLPASAIAKVAFPSAQELGTFIPHDIIPLVYEALKTPPIPEKVDVFGLEIEPSSRTLSPSASTVSSLSQVPTEATPPRPRLKRRRKPSSRFSVDNPFFGYPLEVAEDEARGRRRGVCGQSGESQSDDEGAARHVSRSSETGVPRLRHGRRRKRDLAKTLVMLYWQQWKTQISIGALLFVAFGLFRLARVLKRGQIPGLGGFASRLAKLLSRS